MLYIELQYLLRQKMNIILKMYPKKCILQMEVSRTEREDYLLKKSSKKAPDSIDGRSMSYVILGNRGSL